MRSPLPDSGNLEAGIVDDALPSRLSRVHDNVRNLLRRSLLGGNSASSSPAVPSPRSPHDYILPSPIVAKATQNSASRPDPRFYSSDSTPTPSPNDIPGVLFPPWRQQEAANRSDVPETNARALTTTNHPDLSSPAMSEFLQQESIERQQKAWKRHKHRKQQRRRSSNSVQWAICVTLACVAIGLLGTYIALATSSSSSAAVSPILHVLFVLALLLTTIAFVHSLVRICCLRTTRSNKRIVRIEPAPPRKRRRRHNHHRAQRENTLMASGTGSPSSTSSPSSTEHFIPPTPIPVHVASDTENHEPGSRGAHFPSFPSCSSSSSSPPSSSPRRGQARQEMTEVLDGEAKGTRACKFPPPAYGLTECSVRADPELLHWQVVPSPLLESGLPSPAYEETVGENGTRRGAERWGEGTGGDGDGNVRGGRG